jgi:glucose-6-phosphate 1-dehydrogenase
MKIPGSGFNVQNVNMNFHYSDLSQNKKPEAYERLLLDCMLGDPTLYLRGDAVEKTWEFITPILKAWEHDGQPAYEYPSGTWGPEKADQLIRSETGFDWRNPCYHIEKEDNENDCRFL